MRGEGEGEADSKVLGAYGREILNEKDKLLLGFAEDNKLAPLHTCSAPPNAACPKRSKTPTTARGKHIWMIS